MSLRLLVVALALLLVGCPRKDPPPVPDAAPIAASEAPKPSPPRWEAKARDEAIAAGTAVLDKHQCTRCHAIDAVKTPARPLHCTSCHTFLKGLDPSKDEYQKIAKKYGEPILKRYQANIQHLQKVPDLTGIAKRVRTDWIAKFLAEPHDLRPLLEDSMIRHALEPPEIKAVVRYFAAIADAPDPWAPDFKAPEPPPKPDAARIDQGRTLFLSKGCAGCHTFGNLQTGIDKKTLEAGKSLSMLAPNLRFARERTRPEAIVDWIVDPQKIFPATTMPKMGVTKSEAEAIRDFLFYGDPQLLPMPKLVDPPAPQLLDRKVSWEEAKERVLGKVCVHCHMNDYEKDPGPGNLGGLGFQGVKLQMRTYETLIAGAVDAKGARYSVLVAEKGQTLPPIVRAMLRRKVEAARDQIGPFEDHELPHYPLDGLGMPLGLPSMTDEEISILATWISQGCVGPEKVTGMAGVNDGYLVPDGPIEKNKGCELRAPSKKRPEWAKETEAKSSKP